MSNQYLKNHLPEVEKSIEHFKNEISSLRTGRANPAMVENILVDSYGTKAPLMSLASISVPETRVLSIEPWDKNLLKEIEKAISLANIGAQGVVDGQLVRINFPQMTQEDREKLVKILKEKLEKAKIVIRNIREEIKEEIVEAEKKKEITQDDKFEYLKNLDKEVEEWNKKVVELTIKKEEEILKV